MKNNNIQLIIDEAYEDSIWENKLKQYKKTQTLIKRRRHFKRKVLIAPYIVDENGIIKILTVLGKKHNEWSFVCGTVDKNEETILAASRELFEETKTILDCNIQNIDNVKSFSTFNITENGRIQEYTIYIFRINISESSLISSFDRMKLHGNEYNENSQISFQTLKELNDDSRTWPFIKEKFVNNFYFQHLLLESFYAI
jgi:8-oxo-dGTP pyrophosphatase MutT (NUDIX family)